MMKVVQAPMQMENIRNPLSLRKEMPLDEYICISFVVYLVRHSTKLLSLMEPMEPNWKIFVLRSKDENVLWF